MRYTHIFDLIKLFTLSLVVFSPYYQCSNYFFNYPIGFLLLKYCITPENYIYLIDDFLSLVTICTFIIFELFQCNYVFNIILMIYSYIILFNSIIFSYYQYMSINTNINTDTTNITANSETIAVYINDLHQIDTQELDDWICVICLEDSINDTVLFKCGHYYHKQCIAEWNKINHLCPICKSSLQIPDVSNNIDNHVLNV